MANGGSSGDWLLVQELFERGESSFVDELRRFDDADVLGAFADRWLSDNRPEARRLLFEYLDRPLNAYRHESLVKRLFKLAEAQDDAPVIGRFLAAFDRSVRRIRKKRTHREVRDFEDQNAANTQAAAWRAEGYTSVSVWRNWQKTYQAFGSRLESIVTNRRGTRMPRGTPVRFTIFETFRSRTVTIPDWVVKLRLSPTEFTADTRISDEHRRSLERFQLFSLDTRNYLRRRAWRYFRKLGRIHPERYIPAVTEALLNYRDEDTADGLGLIDNWGMTHILFHYSSVLVANERGWNVAEGRSLADLDPAPIYAKLWLDAPRAIVDLLIGGRCRAVRSWAVRMARENWQAVLAVFSLEERLALLGDTDREVTDLVGDALRDDPELATISPERWLTALENAGPNALELLSDLIAKHVDPARISFDEAVRLAMTRSLPAARLGFQWLQTKTPQSEQDCRRLLALAESEAEPLRPALVAWAREPLSSAPWFQSDWVLEWLDARHRDVRTQAWQWFATDPRIHDDVTIWQRLMETPYDDIRIGLVDTLESRIKGAAIPSVESHRLDPERLRLLWASVLLNIDRGGRTKPLAVRQLLRRLDAEPDDWPQLLPLLGVALRSVRGPERSAGLAAVVRLAERNSAMLPPIRKAFPELLIVSEDLS